MGDTKMKDLQEITSSSADALLSSIEDTAGRRAVDAERGFLAELGGSCDLPAGAYATGR